MGQSEVGSVVTAEGWEYSPAPERTRPEIDSEYGLFIGGEFRAPQTGRTFDTINPATGERLARIAEAGQSDVDAAMAAARAAGPKWARLKGRERGKYLFRLARRIQECSRELAVLETMDGGKPIKESRDIDLPLVAQHFFYHAGWADKLQWAFGGRDVKPRGVCGQTNHSLEFPTVDGGVEVGASDRLRQYRCAQARRDNIADSPSSCQTDARNRFAAGRGQYSDWCRRDGPHGGNTFRGEEGGLYWVNRCRPPDYGRTRPTRNSTHA